jgi:signal transduction histidine kinase
MNRRQRWVYAALLAVCFLVSVAAAWTTLGRQFDNDIYDFLFRLHPVHAGEPAAAVLGIDEQTLRSTRGGLHSIRSILTAASRKLAAAAPRAVVVDLILADTGLDPAQDSALGAALGALPNLVLATDLAGGEWEEPIEPFRRVAKAVGHVHSLPDPYDNVVRRIPLERVSQRHQRRFALALEAFRLAEGAEITESPGSIEAGGIALYGRPEEGRPLWVRYRPPESPVPVVTVHELHHDPAAVSKLKGRVVFVGITAQSAAQDRHMTPYSFGQTMPGVEIHANAYDTLVRRDFLAPASNTFELSACVLLAVSAGVIFAVFPGWPAYVLAAAVLMAVHLAPYVAFRGGVILPYAPLLSSAWLSIVFSASYQYFFVRRMLDKSEAEKERYQRAIHFVAHEMRTPLTAIQGSSELMGRYKLPEEKQSEMARMINSESKRLARLIQTFLDVERLTEGQMELKREPFDPREVIDLSLDRARPLAERKQILLDLGSLDPAVVNGDRELMEYAVYNLINNAIKYSPAQTVVRISGHQRDRQFTLAVTDQGIGMDDQELKSIFRKFYRTKRAEATGEIGTGIGLSIVDQIVTHHGGRMEVSSRPGAGSRFAMILPVAE